MTAMDTGNVDTAICTGKKRRGGAFVVWVLIASCLAHGCAVKRVGVEDQRSATLFQEVIVRQIGYTEKGLPVPGPALKKRPTRAHQQFTIAQFMNNQLATSFDIAVVERNVDFTKPFKAIYKWTGKGFEWGINASSKTANALGSVNIFNGEELVVYLVIVVSPLAACTAGGIVIGVADGIRETAVELGKVVVNKHERVITYTTYAYDAHNRLSLMRMYKADDQKELVRTEFVYEGDSEVPAKATITRYPEGAVQVLQ